MDRTRKNPQSASQNRKAKQQKLMSNTNTAQITNFFHKKPEAETCSHESVLIAEVSERNDELPIQETHEHQQSCLTKVDEGKEERKSFEDETTVIPSDFGHAVEKKFKLTEHDRLFYMTSRWVPANEDEFPKSEHKLPDGRMKVRKLTRKHLDQFAWVAVSQMEGYAGAWCSFCVLFQVIDKVGGHTQFSGSGNQRVGKLVSEPLTNFKDLTGNKGGALSSHALTMYHQQNVTRGGDFMRRAINTNEQIKNQIDTLRMKEVKENREALVHIINAIKFLAIQNLPLRGHRDDGDLISKSNEINENFVTFDECLSNDGNFRQLLRFSITSGNEALKKHLMKAGKRTHYTSKTIQNALLSDMGFLLKESIVIDIKKSPCWVILADETTDSAHRELIVLSARYLSREDGKYVIKEDPFALLDLISELRLLKKVSETGEIRLSGENISSVIMSAINTADLPLHSLVGQCYDGAACMRSMNIGVAAFILKRAPLAYYFHCASHAVNLSVSLLNKNKVVRRTQDILTKLTEYFNSSAKRHEHLALLFKENDKVTRWTTLLRLCQTRFVERHTALNRFCDAFPVIVKALRKMEKFEDQRTSDQATQYLNTIMHFDFLIGILSSRKLCCQLRPLTLALQQTTLDLTTALKMVDATTNILSTWRKESEASFHEVFQEACNVATSLDIIVAKPRTSHKSIFRGNTNTTSDIYGTEQYFRVEIWNDVLDHILQDLCSRFTDHHRHIFSLSKLIPMNVKVCNFDDVLPALTMYQSHIHYDVSMQDLKAEFTSWQSLWQQGHQSYEHVPISAIHSLNECSAHIFPNLFRYLCILTCLPVSTAEPERLFSKVSLIMSILRTSMTHERLENLVLLSCHRNRLPSNTAVIDRFAMSGVRKLDFTFPI